VLVFQAMLSAVADALHARDGVVVTDRLTPSSGLTDPYTQRVVTIRPGRPEEVLGALDGRARALGYLPDRSPHHVPEQATERHWYRYESVRHLPKLVFALAAPHELRGIAVPDGSVAVTVDISTGLTESEDGRSSCDAPNTAVTTHLRDRGVGIAPPLRRRRLTWWPARVAAQAQLARAARRLGARRGRHVVTWLVGGEFTGPCTLGVMTIRHGTREQVTEGIARRMHNRDHRHATAATGFDHSPVMNLATYGPGEPITTDGRTVPEGSLGVVITLSRT